MSDKLEFVHGLRTDWSVTVRITRIWGSFNENGHFMGCNFILLDAENYHVHAFIHQPNWDAVANAIVEGNIYQITNFQVTQAIGTLRPVSSSNYIILTHNTIIENKPNDPMFPIPEHKFELVDLGDLNELCQTYVPNQRPIYAIDIIGQVEYIGPLRIIQTKLGEKLLRKINIHDGRHSVTVAFWDEDVDILDPLVNGNFESPPIVIFAAMRPKVYQGSLEVLCLSHERGCRIFININYEPVYRLRERLAADDHSPGNPTDDA